MGKEYAIKFPCAVRRIRLAWRDRQWVVVKSVRVSSMTLPRSQQLYSADQEVGGCFDAVDGEGNILYRSPAPNPQERFTETFERDGSIRPHLLEGIEQTVEVLIPDHRSFKNLIYRPLRTRANDSKRTKDQTISIEEIVKKEKK